MIPRIALGDLAHDQRGCRRLDARATPKWRRRARSRTGEGERELNPDDGADQRPRELGPGLLLADLVPGVVLPSDGGPRLATAKQAASEKPPLEPTPPIRAASAGAGPLLRRARAATSACEAPNVRRVLDARTLR